MNTFKFPVINPLLHSELRLKIMVALDSLESADFMYLCQITDSTRGNLSSQIARHAGAVFAYCLSHYQQGSRSLERL